MRQRSAVPESNEVLPAVVDRPTAIAAARIAIGAAALKVTLKVLFVVASMGLPASQLTWGPWTLTSAVLFAIVAFGIYRLSRAAAVGGLILCVVDSLVASTPSPTVLILFVICFLAGIRAAVLFHRLPDARRTESADAA